ncbi:MAG: DUF72 domain-containing protein [Balneolaceae bacterium]|nr:DUF72 domain-containing protein [Balneolaceae bacterium]
MAITKYHIGCTGWSQKAWVGTFFTDDAKQKEYLSQYATVFNSVEGNTTFYHIPDRQTVKSWAQRTPDGFKFCFKFHRSITHNRRLKDVEDEVLRFLEVFEDIEERLGPFHIQLPPQFAPDEIEKLEVLLTVLPTTYRYAVEVRHPDFFDHGRVENRLNRLLGSYNIDRVIFDTRKLHAMNSDDPTVLEAQEKKPKLPVRFDTTGSRPFVRFVGANDALNNEPYLKEWAIIMADWIKEGLHPYIFTHSPDQISQPEIARKFHQILSELIEMNPMPAWPAERQSLDDQLNLF